MALVKLKQNLIFDGAFHRVDSILEEDDLPEKFRTPEFIEKPAGPPAESDWEEYPLEDDVLGPEEEEPPPPPPPKKR
jgi:hypothetical protein